MTRSNGADAHQAAIASALPATTSTAQWLAVSTTAAAISTGCTQTAALLARRDAVAASAVAARRDQPTWKLGMAPNGLRTASGWATPAQGVPATTSANPIRRGGATGKAV